MAMRIRTVLVLALLPAALLTGCTKAPRPSTPAAASAAPTASEISGTADSTPAGTPTPPSSNPPSSVRTSTVPTASTPPPAPASGPPGCATSALKIAVLRGSGAAGHQFAYFQFTNSSASTCSLVGFPGAVLMKSGAQLGKPADRSNVSVGAVVLRSGATATARLENDSTCNADNSDAVQVIVPNRTEKVVLPLQMRGCPLMIDPVMPS